MVVGDCAAIPVIVKVVWSDVVVRVKLERSIIDSKPVAVGTLRLEEE